jgi:hypothetical protein
MNLRILCYFVAFALDRAIHIDLFVRVRVLELVTLGGPHFNNPSTLGLAVVTPSNSLGFLDMPHRPTPNLRSARYPHCAHPVKLPDRPPNPNYSGRSTLIPKVLLRRASEI